MKQVKKIIALAIGSLMSVSVLAGCSVNGLALYDAFSKSSTVKASETKTDIYINVSAQNLSAQEQPIAMYLPMINASKFSIDTKIMNNEDRTAGKLSSNVAMQVGAMPINAGIWVDTDFSQGNKKLKEVVQVPNIVTSQVPQLKGKQYIVMDLSQMLNTPGAVSIDYSKLTEIQKAFQPKLNNFINSYIKQYNPQGITINKLNRGTLQGFAKTEAVDVYQLKLDDTSFKNLLKYTVTNFGDNKDAALSFLKDYLLTIEKMTESMGQTSNMNVEKIINNLSAKLPEIVSQVSSEVDALNNIRLLGEDGITLEYGVDADGYIVNETGTIQVVLDCAALEKLAGPAALDKTSDVSGYTGVYTVTLNFNTDIRRMNSSETIQLPETNDSNSISYEDLMNMGVSKTESGIDEAYKNAYNSVMIVTNIAKKNNVKPSFFKYEGSLEAGVSDTDAVVNAASYGLQEYINSARNQINALPDELLQQKRTLSSILDNYQNSIYERAVYLINSNKDKPKESEIIKARILIKQINTAYKASYSSALDSLQSNILKNADDLVNKAIITKTAEDIDNANKAIEELKTIPAEFLDNNTANLINSIEAKLK